MKYRMRDGVEAWRITEENATQLADMVKGKVRQNITIRGGRPEPLHTELSFNTHSAGWVTLTIGDYVVLEQSGNYEGWDGVRFEEIWEPMALGVAPPPIDYRF